MGEIVRANGRPDWDSYYMNLTLGVATRASCRYVLAGATVVNNNRIIATGYNGAAPNVANCLTADCRKRSRGIGNELKGTGECRGTHAEMNGMQYAGKECVGATLYTVLFPCNHCAKQAASSGITRIVYAIKYRDADPTAATETLTQSGIQVQFFSDLTGRSLEEELEKQHQRLLEVARQGR